MNKFMYIKGSQMTNREQSRIKMINRCYVLNEILKISGKDIINQRMVKDNTLDERTKSMMKIKNVNNLKYEIDGIIKNPSLHNDEKNIMLEYGLKRAYNFVLSKMCEYMLSCLKFIEKEQDEYSKTADISIFGIPYDVKLVDWNNGNPNYYCYRDYGQRKIWIAYNTKCDLANPNRLKSLMDYAQSYLMENKDSIINGKIRNIYINGSDY